VGVASDPPVDVGTGGLASEKVAALSVDLLVVLDVAVVLALEVASVPPVVPDIAAVGVLTRVEAAQPTTLAVPATIAIAVETTHPWRLKPSTARRGPHSKDMIHTIFGNSR